MKGESMTPEMQARWASGLGTWGKHGVGLGRRILSREGFLIEFWGESVVVWSRIK